MVVVVVVVMGKADANPLTLDSPFEKITVCTSPCGINHTYYGESRALAASPLKMEENITSSFKGKGRLLHSKKPLKITSEELREMRDKIFHKHKGERLID